MTRRGPSDGGDTELDPTRTRLGVGETADRGRGTDLVGQVVGGYLIEEELGAGGMGAVYRASHVDTDRVVALKALHAHHLDEPAIVKRFLREAKLVARLAHPNIVGVIESFAHEDGRHLIVLEFVEGEPLTDLLTMPLPPERVVGIVAQLLRGLEHAHAAGVIHRDLKPDNVLVSWRDGHEHVQIVDFGIAILRDPDEGSQERLTATGQTIGTPIYMAPEQSKGEKLDHRADLFPLGIIMYEMLAGMLPFGGNALAVAAANINRDAPPIAERAPDVLCDPLLDLFARKLMARRPDDRFETAGAALAVLDLISSDRESAALALGIMDVERALALVSLPAPPEPLAES